MRYAVISDLHANLPALEAVLADIDGRGDVDAFGHTHKPWHRVIEGIRFVNAGSVGRAKDGERRDTKTTVSRGCGPLTARRRP